MARRRIELYSNPTPYPIHNPILTLITLKEEASPTPEPAPDDDVDMRDIVILIEPLSSEYEDIATQGEAEKSGNELQVPDGFIVEDACPKMVKALEGTY